MNININNISNRFFILLIIPFLFFTCDLFDDDIEYYSVKGEGYIYDIETNEPIGHTCSVCVDIYLYGENKIEYYEADYNGYFQIKFLKYIKNKNALFYEITVGAYDYVSDSIKPLIISIETIKESKTIIQLDTFKLKRIKYL